MSAVQFSELELFNLTLLLGMRDSIARDVVTACGQFGLREEDARYLGSLSTTQILATVANVGSQPLFSPRADLFSMMRAPLPLAAPLIAVRPAAAVQPRAAWEEGVRPGDAVGVGVGVGVGVDVGVGVGVGAKPGGGTRAGTSLNCATTMTPAR